MLLNSILPIDLSHLYQRIRISIFIVSLIVRKTLVVLRTYRRPSNSLQLPLYVVGLQIIGLSICFKVCVYNICAISLALSQNRVQILSLHDVFTNFSRAGIDGIVEFVFV